MLNTLYSGNRLRVDFAKTPQQIEVPNLLQLQQSSYDNFLMLDANDRSKLAPVRSNLLMKQIRGTFPSSAYRQFVSD